MVPSAGVRMTMRPEAGAAAEDASAIRDIPVPGRKYSARAASRSFSNVMSRALNPTGRAGCMLARSRCKYRMMSCHAGPAPVTPLTWRMLTPVLLPTHTPTVYLSDQPTVQLSRISLLVPVLTAVQDGVDHARLRAKGQARAWPVGGMAA